MPRSRPWSASRSSWGSRGSGRPFACASRAVIAGCAVAAPGTVCAVVMAHVAAHTYALAERGPAAPLFHMFGRGCCQKTRECVLVPVGTLAEQVDWCHERMCVGVCRVSVSPLAPAGRHWILIAACLHALAHFLAASVSNPGRNRVTARNSHASRAAREWRRAREETGVKIEAILQVHDNPLAQCGLHRCKTVTGKRRAGFGSQKGTKTVHFLHSD